MNSALLDGAASRTSLSLSASSTASTASTDVSTAASPAPSPHSNRAMQAALQLQMHSPSSSPPSSPSPYSSSSSAPSTDSPLSLGSSLGGSVRREVDSGRMGVAVKREKPVDERDDERDRYREDSSRRKRHRSWEAHVRQQHSTHTPLRQLLYQSLLHHAHMPADLSRLVCVQEDVLIQALVKKHGGSDYDLAVSYPARQPAAHSKQQKGAAHHSFTRHLIQCSHAAYCDCLTDSGGGQHPLARGGAPHDG